MTKRSAFLRSFSNLIDDKAGNFGIMAAIIVPVAVVGAGSAIDYFVANAEHTHLQNIADAAALTGGKVFDGTNLPAATLAAENSIKAQVETTTEDELAADQTLATKVRYTVSAKDNTLKVDMTKEVPTSLMRIAGVDSVSIGVSAAALSPMKPEEMTFTPTKAQGWYFKKISILVLRKGATTEEVVGTVVYKPTTQADGGQGTYVANPAGVIKLGKYSNLALRMDIKNDGCDIGYKATVKNSKITCNASTKAVDKTYNAVLRTDDPATSHHLFVDGKQVPQGVKASLEKYFGCSKQQEHAWEDGGGWERQDFFYKVTATCAPDGEYVRLVK